MLASSRARSSATTLSGSEGSVIRILATAGTPVDRGCGPAPGPQPRSPGVPAVARIRMTEPSLPDKVVALDRALDDASIDHAFGGALALAYYAEPRSTVD